MQNIRFQIPKLQRECIPSSDAPSSAGGQGKETRKALFNRMLCFQLVEANTSLELFGRPVLNPSDCEGGRFCVSSSQ
jgi:hypothetical protein